MKQTRLLMGMPITLDVVDASVTHEDLEDVFALFLSVDEAFSTYKDTSDISRINRGELRVEQASALVQMVLELGEQTRRETRGYFDMQRGGMLDPSGIVKGWAVRQAARMLTGRGFQHFYVDAGGDIQVVGQHHGGPWRVGIRNPFNRHGHVKVLALTNRGVATSGTAIRGQHIYNPYQPTTPIHEIVSLTVIGPDIYEADRFATAAFAMGREGIRFIESVADCEGYLIDEEARATCTSGFERYVVHA